MAAKPPISKPLAAVQSNVALSLADVVNDIAIDQDVVSADAAKCGSIVGVTCVAYGSDGIISMTRSSPVVVRHDSYLKLGQRYISVDGSALL